MKMQIYNKIIMYDDENMQYVTGQIANLNMDYEPIEVHTTDSPYKKFLRPRGIEITGYINDPVLSETINLDETLMKRIAKYNKEAEIKKYDELIKQKKEEIKQLDDILQDKEKRVDKIKEFVANIYDLDISEDDDYDYYDD